MLLQRLKSIVFEIFLRSDRPFGNVEFSLWSKQRCFPKLNFLRDSSPLWLTSTTKVELISKPAPTHIFKQFPTNIWISKFFVLMIFAVKMRLEPMGYWISLNFNVIFFNSLFVVESEFQNSNVGGKKHENLCRCRFWNILDISKNYNFAHLTVKYEILEVDSFIEIYEKYNQNVIKLLITKIIRILENCFIVLKQYISWCHYSFEIWFS